MTTVITGATGQVGLHLIDELRRRGRGVRAMVLPTDRGLEGRDVEIAHADVRDYDSVRSAFEGAEVVYHLAAIVSTKSDAGSLIFDVNLDGAKNVARAAREAGVRRLVHFSSIVVFEPDPIDRPLDEARARVRRNGSPYTLSKVLGEIAVREEIARGLDAVIVHPTVIVGPHETHHEGIVRNLIAQHYAGKLPALVEGGFNLVDVLDVVAGALAAEVRGRSGESYILGGQWYSVADLLSIAESVSGKPRPKISIPLWVARAALPLMELGATALRAKPMYNKEELAQLAGNPNIRSDKAQRELGYTPRPIDDSLRRIYSWLAT